MRSRTASALILGALVASVCSVAPPQVDGQPGVAAAASEAGRTAIEARETVTAAAPTFQTAPVALPTPPATTPELPLPESVPVHEPRVVVDDTAAPDAATSVDGVAESVQAAKLTATSRTPDGDDRTLSILVVDPAAFRSFTPEATANSAAVWERLRDGDLIITHSSGTALGAILGDTITLSGPAGSSAIRVGAFASTGAPPLADIIVSWDRGRDLGANTANTSIVSLDEGADEATVRDDLQEAIGGQAELRIRPQEQQASASLGNVVLEPFTYTDNGDGMITIDSGWVQRNIASIEIPEFGRMRCHREILPQLDAAFAELRALGLQQKLNNYGGCYVPRHILFNPSRALSRHAWGLAFDTNVPTNQYGAVPTLDMRIVEVFRKWGFKWGGDFSTPDGMHFELERVVRPG